ncbi:cytochrome c peroxidase [Microbulbifer pacificus]|uniref:Cytochrome c peroxidase n=1 Tax=Microbulbifer pacificus TaxID=407164 RepID=A0AAU0MZA0_9GAMM|nr:cytochrome c peroxidase [Microbulbifer pacificus]WOX05536.1 cytochrome c peroxidase [Microbulbifer pacificus]
MLSTTAFGHGKDADNAKLGENHALKLLGKHVFFDKSLSRSGEMGCVSCHEPFAGGTNGDSEINARQVAVTSANGVDLGRRKPQTNTYASFIGPFVECDRGGPSPITDTEKGITGKRYCGGNFWDGRALGRMKTEDESLLNLILGATEHIGEEIFYNIEQRKANRYQQYISSISDQAINPIPNDAEQDMSRYDVCQTVANSSYAFLYKKAWGVRVNCSADIATGNDTFVDITFKRLMFSVGAYQHSKDKNSFSSKRDLALRAELACVDKTLRRHRDPAVCRMVRKLKKTNPDKEYGKFPLVLFTDEENLGHDLFYNVQFAGIQRTRTDLPATQCAFCHSDDPGLDDGTELQQIYSDRAYHNIGTPPNPEIPALAGQDVGVAKITRSLDGPTHFDGFFRAVTLRNTAKGASDEFTKGYTHNGFFKSLKSLVHFYVTRSTLGDSCNTRLANGNLLDDAGLPLPLDTPLTEAVALKYNCWPAPEFPVFASPTNLVGGLGTPEQPVTEEHEDALVAYLQTLSDTHDAKPPVLLQFGVRNPLASVLGGDDLDSMICDEGATRGDCVGLEEAMQLLGEDWLSADQ